MNSLMHYFKSTAYLLLSGCLLSASVYADENHENNICHNTDVVIAFFNGVQTTPSGANRGKEELKRIHGDKSEQGDDIRYEVMYNYTNGLEDFAETFEQRLQEQEQLLNGRYELFFEALRGGGTWWQNITNTISSASDILDAIAERDKAELIQKLSSLLGDPPSINNYQEHQAKIDNWVLKGFKLLYVAHSQGNLFVNEAYRYTTTKVDAESVKVVHIAPASPIVNGPHTLANLDLVINGLRLVGNVVENTDDIPGYLFRPAGVNGGKDILGHGLIEIYINQGLDIANRVKTHINDALNTLVAPTATASQGFFTAQLTWDGTGDVDLHVYEPNGSHVYYSDSNGDSGYLDVDNTTSYGPEHYFASCESDKLQVGTYKVSVANYSDAEGRRATVQIDSSQNGVLGTKEVTLGAETGDDPAYDLFNVTVSKDDEGKYSVNLN